LIESDHGDLKTESGMLKARIETTGLNSIFNSCRICS